MVTNLNTQPVEVNPWELKPHPENPRKGDVEKIKESIEANGFYGYLIVQKSTGYVLAGNHRLQAASELGFKTVPVIYVDVDDVKARRILLADNRSNDLAEYDSASLADLLNELYDENDPDSLLGTGFSQYDLAEIERKVKLKEVPIDFGDYKAEDEDFGDVNIPMPSPPQSLDSQVYMVNLFLKVATAPVFLERVRALGEEYGTSTPTDTVWAVIEKAYGELL